jgi:hypothetical protein
MLTRPEVIEVEEAPFAFLFYAEAGEAYDQGTTDFSGHGDIVQSFIASHASNFLSPTY